jgi:hypothetical protein
MDRLETYVLGSRTDKTRIAGPDGQKEASWVVLGVVAEWFKAAVLKGESLVSPLSRRIRFLPCPSDQGSSSFPADSAQVALGRPCLPTKFPTQVEMASLVISGCALAFTLFSFWWMNWWPGRLWVAKPRSFAVVRPG